MTSINTQAGNTPHSSTEMTTIEAAVAMCGMCQDAGYYCLDVPISDPNFGQLIVCQCRMTEKMERQRQRMVELSNLGALEDKTFATFNPDISGVRAAYTRCKEYARNPQGWLFLFGSYGCGKTHLAAAIANDVVQRECDTIWTVVPDLLDHLRSTFGPSSEVAYDARFETVRNIPLLILDDLGTESATPWAREKLFQLMNHRYNCKLPTVITSNQDLDRLDPRIRSRLNDIALCQSILIKAGDFRALNIDQRYSSFRSFGR